MVQKASFAHLGYVVFYAGMAYNSEHCIEGLERGVSKLQYKFIGKRRNKEREGVSSLLCTE